MFRLPVKIPVFFLLASLSFFAHGEKPALKIDYSKAKITYVDFWAAWCIPCRASFPWMDEMHRKYAEKGLQIVAVNLDEDKTAVNEFLKKLPADFQIISDPDATLATQFNVQVMPSSFILDNKGKLLDTHYGFNNKAKQVLEGKIQALLEVK